MSNRTPASVNKLLKRQELLICFKIAIGCSDPLTQRTEIGKTLRLATIGDIDGLEVLYEALLEKYSTLMPVENQEPTSDMYRLYEASGEYKCISCNELFASAKALSGHGPNRCKTKRNQK